MCFETISLYMNITHELGNAIKQVLVDSSNKKQLRGVSLHLITLAHANGKFVSNSIWNVEYIQLELVRQCWEVYQQTTFD